MPKGVIQCRIGPGDWFAGVVPASPSGILLQRERTVKPLCCLLAHGFGIGRGSHYIPDFLILDFTEREISDIFAGTVEVNDCAIAVDYEQQKARIHQNFREQILLEINQLLLLPPLCNVANDQ